MKVNLNEEKCLMESSGFCVLCLFKPKSFKRPCHRIHIEDCDDKPSKYPKTLHGTASIQVIVKALNINLENIFSIDSSNDYDLRGHLCAGCYLLVNQFPKDNPEVAIYVYENDEEALIYTKSLLEQIYGKMMRTDSEKTDVDAFRKEMLGNPMNKLGGKRQFEIVTRFRAEVSKKCAILFSGDVNDANDEGAAPAPIPEVGNVKGATTDDSSADIEFLYEGPPRKLQKTAKIATSPKPKPTKVPVTSVVNSTAAAEWEKKKIILCDVCGKILTSQAKLWDHLRSGAHSKNDNCKCLCKHCRKIFPSFGDLQAHWREECKIAKENQMKI